MDNEKDRNGFFPSDDADETENGMRGVPFGPDDDDEPVEGSISGGAFSADDPERADEEAADLSFSDVSSSDEFPAERDEKDGESQTDETDGDTPDDGADEKSADEEAEKADGKEKDAEKTKKNSISSDLIRGHINTIILRTLYEGDRYGYDIISEIEHKSHGQYTLKQPTLYSALKRLESQGYVKSYWGGVSNGGRRRYFSLTESGREIAEQNQAEWEYSRTIIDSLISENDFDFSNPAPEKLDFRILRQATSRTPIVGEESAEPYSSLILEAKETDAPAQSPQTIDTVETVTAEIPAPAYSDGQPSAPAPTANEQAPVATQYAADAQGQNENAAPSAAATDAADTAQNTEETAKTAEETQPVADERQAEIAPTADAPMPPNDNREADKKDSPIPPLYITRTEEEKNYKEIVSRIYHTARSRHDADAVKENEAPLPRDEEAFASENSAAFADEAPQAAREAQPLRRENEAEGQRYAQASEPTVRYNEQAEPPARPLTPGRIDFRDVEEMARYDGLRVWTAGSATQKRQMPEDFFNKGLTLLRASLIFFTVAITETVLAAVFRESLQLEVWYLITMLVCAVLPPAVCTILYLIKFQPCCKRLKNNTSVYNGIVAFIATFILLVAVDLIADVSLTDGLTVVQFIVIPLVYLLNIIVFAVAYYLLSRSKV